jgi:hypothetical protein
MFSQDDIYKLSLTEQHVKRIVTQKEPIGGINDFCNLVRFQQKIQTYLYKMHLR